MQFPDACVLFCCEKRGISTVAFQNMKCSRKNCMRMYADQIPHCPRVPRVGAAGAMDRWSETAVAFAGTGRASNETGIAFAGENWVFLARFSVALVMVVSRWPVSVVVEVSLVSPSPPQFVLCAKKFALRAQKGPRSAFYGVLGELFRENASRGAAVGERCRAVGVAGMPCDYTWVRPGAPPTARPKQVARYRAKRTARPRIMRGRAAIRRIKQR